MKLLGYLLGIVATRIYLPRCPTKAKFAILPHGYREAAGSTLAGQALAGRRLEVSTHLGVATELLDPIWQRRLTATPEVGTATKQDSASSMIEHKADPILSGGRAA